MDDIDHNKLDAALERLEAERERRLAEKIEAGEIIEVPLWVVAGSQAGARAQVEQAKADKLAELRAAGETREVVFDVTTVATGVVRPGEATGPAWKPTAPPYLPRLPAAEVPTERGRSYSGRTTARDRNLRAVQVRQCQDDDDPGEIAEGWFSVDGKGCDGHRREWQVRWQPRLLKGEDARVVAKQLPREGPGGRELQSPAELSECGAGVIGRRFGKLLVIEGVPAIDRYARFRCRCDCGALTEVRGLLRSLASVS